MTKLEEQKIFDKLQGLDEYVGYLKNLSEETKEDKEKFLKDFHYFGTAERYLQLAVQVIIDVVQLVIINEGLEKPDDNQEAISLLHGKKIISSELATRLDGIVGFRNILVHEYGKIDKVRVYEYLQHRINDINDFKKEILQYLSS